MSPEPRPLVSIVTPVYNGEKYIAECIESVLRQTYPHWKHTIVNNCSQDRTLEIVEGYARRDPRIQVRTNTSFVDVIQNHNHAFREVDGASVYCKPLEADDWLFPDCLEELVRVAEAHPETGIIGSYVLHGTRVECDGLPHPSGVVGGHEICRLNLLRKVYTFLSPSGLLIRADLVRERDPFYAPGHLHADVESCYEILARSDFGFVHQVLSFVRRHADSVTASHAERFNTISLANLELLMRFGPRYLAPGEYEARLRRQLDEYYRSLARSFVRSRDRGQIWRDHAERLEGAGYRLSTGRLLRALALGGLGRALRR